MAARAGLFIFVTLFGIWGAPDVRRELVVWNIGQGQWATVIDEKACWHLDMGGEFAPWHSIEQRCRGRANLVSLSHWDIDHLSFVAHARARLPQLCLLNRPEGEGSARKLRVVDALPRCTQKSPFAQWSDAGGKSANDKSWVVAFRGVLAPGDSTRREEAKWISALPLRGIHILILGHHGSRTSTSMDLLRSLPNLQVAVSSARFRRYGHPHAEVVEELRRVHVPLLRTEEWGTLHFAL